MSVTAVRKERERAAREELILDHAKQVLLRDGYQDLNLGDLAKAIEYSKGAIYLHFDTKEDLALAVLTRALKGRADMFERAAGFKGRARERARAIGVACCQFAIANRDYFSVEMMLKSASFWEKASEERRRQHNLHAGRCFRAMDAIVQDAIREGDLPAAVRSGHVVFSFIAVTIGSHIASANPDIQFYCGIDDPIESARRHYDLLCDGWQWKPLTREWGYTVTDRRIREEIFPEATWLKTA